MNLDAKQTEFRRREEQLAILHLDEAKHFTEPIQRSDTQLLYSIYSVLFLDQQGFDLARSPESTIQSSRGADPCLQGASAHTINTC
jgi:hypothetical protein